MRSSAESSASLYSHFKSEDVTYGWTESLSCDNLQLRKHKDDVIVKWKRKQIKVKQTRSKPKKKETYVKWKGEKRNK